MHDGAVLACTVPMLVVPALADDLRVVIVRREYDMPIPVVTYLLPEDNRSESRVLGVLHHGITGNLPHTSSSRTIGSLVRK